MKTTLSILRGLPLLLAGSLLTLVAVQILVSPQAFYAASGIVPGTDTSLLNELKAPALFLLLAGGFMLTALVRRHLAPAATWLAVAIYLGFAGSRMISMLTDGLPSGQLVQVTALEVIVGLVCVAGLALEYRRKDQPSLARA